MLLARNYEQFRQLFTTSDGFVVSACWRMLWRIWTVMVMIEFGSVSFGVGACLLSSWQKEHALLAAPLRVRAGRGASSLSSGFRPGGPERASFSLWRKSTNLMLWRPGG